MLLGFFGACFNMDCELHDLIYAASLWSKASLFDGNPFQYFGFDSTIAKSLPRFENNDNS